MLALHLRLIAATLLFVAFAWWMFGWMEYLDLAVPIIFFAGMFWGLAFRGVFKRIEDRWEPR